ncbi:NitT/TauT family transport system substrate-binding protein/putative hydroxymethylpyrimidine transport system substrate-binding protein [Solirubrobacter pauli]|uniref:Thiamine pyrimidine synthase n=1 Tax=Solirubrobacter pauli TaxID=166793 RepID=A0A660LJI5_9ACTN|nr:NitT/TauT family transport system substrate-binding protein/putative hydroxymethylpyrimidine transport system substrate-binding protein [Solirubrobacter pauli]
MLLLVLVAGCGDEKPASPSSSPPPARPVTVALDFVPNPVHAPIYLAGDAVKIQKPGSGPDGLKLVTSGKVELGVLDIHDLAIAREAGTDVVAVGALVGKPLAALVAQPDITRPRDLEGRTVGVSGLPSDPAFLQAIVGHDGGDVSKIKQVTIGFNAVSRLLTKRVDAVPVFWNAEGVALKQRGLEAKEFRVEDYGAPPYPEVVFFTSRATLDAERDRIAGALDAIAGGLEAARARPEEAVDVIAKAAETDDRELVRAQVDAVLPIFADGLKLDRAVLERWADFDAEIGLVKERPDVDATFDFSVRAEG